MRDIIPVESSSLSSATTVTTGGNKPKITVVRADCVDVGLRLLEQQTDNTQPPPLVLVHASKSNPGGGYKNGAGAAEESICRRTSLFYSLEDPYGLMPDRKSLYPINMYGGIYCPDVMVIRDSLAGGYGFLKDIKSLAFVNVAAFVRPATEQITTSGSVTGKTERQIVPDMANKVKRKMETMLHIARHHGHKQVVLGAWGCGAFANPPKHIAELFKEVIYDSKFGFAEYFEHISFAIIEDHNALRNNAEGNCAPFAKVFGCDILELDQL
ncbi:hypothetical protein GQ42DRAFT_116554 [Ramicandelaber brevisporus]|nr:hypothetical protein GQ42DRAFT_116554 [Ramicandelaber brevisporus]